jgi:SAM-dependent methyltransferase
MISKLDELVRRLAKGVLRFIENILWGGDRFESLLLLLLRNHYRSRFRREWKFRVERPHFFQKRIAWFLAGFASDGLGPYPFYAGFFNTQVLQRGDTVLDIGCGDGFYTRQFYSERASHIDAIDIDDGAIAEARAWYQAPNITYWQMDAVRQPFPRPHYELVVWDGALGHFSTEVTAMMLGKIRDAITDKGLFVGSESLGEEGHDHLQFFHSLDSLGAILAKYFHHVQMREQQYRLINPALIRREAYWRCSNRGKLVMDHWIPFQANIQVLQNR